MQNLKKISGGNTWSDGLIFYLIAFMAEFLYAGKNINEELRKAKSTKISGGKTLSD